MLYILVWMKGNLLQAENAIPGKKAKPLTNGPGPW